MSPQLTPKKQKILNYIQNYIREHHYSPTLEEMAKKLKVSSKATVHQHLSELEAMGLINRGFNKTRDISLNNLNKSVEAETNSSLQTIALPIAGLITAGSPIEAIEDGTEMLSVPRELVRQENSYILKVKGDSMIESLIADGDYVIIEKRDYANDGDIVVALLDDGTATLKEFHREKNYIRLQPRNPNYKPLKVKSVIIQGKVAGIIRKY
ncbi:MAG: transcriptional repressor LexA [Patescibacteria group bacterium]